MKAGVRSGARIQKRAQVDRRVGNRRREAGKVEIIAANWGNIWATENYGKLWLEKHMKSDRHGLAGTEVAERCWRRSTLMKATRTPDDTGKLGDVMQESAQAARALAGRSAQFGLPKDSIALGIHLHVPEGAIRKAGPSAGITICTSCERADGIPVRLRVGRDGEITLAARDCPSGVFYQGGKNC